MNNYLYSYKPNSSSAKALADGLGIRRIRHNNSRFIGDGEKIVINWGSTEVPDEVGKCIILNHPHDVTNAANKLYFFNLMGDIYYIPLWTDSKATAISWIREGRVVVCRTQLRGHSGAGIVIAHNEEQLVDAPLYVEYKKKKDEYRIHIMNSIVFDIQRKARRLEFPDNEVNWQVRNHDNGFIYKREDVYPPDGVINAAVGCFNLSNLNFGAVDVIYNAHEDRAYVLEINTAPGLEGTTLDNYIAEFKKNL